MFVNNFMRQLSAFLAELTAWASSPTVVRAAGGSVLLIAPLAFRPSRDLLLHCLGRVYCVFYPEGGYMALFLPPDVSSAPVSLQKSRLSAYHPIVKREAAKHGLSAEAWLNGALNDSSVEPEIGQLVKAWDFVTIWDEYNITSEELETWRSRADAPVDAALEDLDSRGILKGGDLIETIEDVIGKDEAAEDSGIRQFWTQVTARPPKGAGALSQEWYTEHPNASLEEELQAEKAVIARGQDLFYRYYGGILTALLHFSLAGGFASPRIVRVLEQTGYLLSPASQGEVSKSRADRTWMRLMETSQWVLDVLDGGPEALDPPNASNRKGGVGWRNTVRVRILHGRVKRRIIKSLDRLDGAYSIDRDGLPINQEDLAATLGSFSIAVLVSLQRMGVNPTPQEREDFVALWRHIGFYMGIEPSILQRCFQTAHAADQFLFSIVRHLFADLEEDVKAGRETPPAPTMPVLRSVSDRPPFFVPKEAHCASSRHMIGSRLASALHIPPTPFKYVALLQLTYVTVWYPVLFGTYWRSGWERSRRDLARPLLRRLITWSMGLKISRFSGEGTSLEEKTLDQAEGQLLVRKWKLVMREMLLVTAVFCSIPIFAVWKVASR